MNPEETKKNTPPQVELKDEELKEVAGGVEMKSYCPTCKRYFRVVGKTCPQCQWDGITSYLVPV